MFVLYALISTRRGAARRTQYEIVPDVIVRCTLTTQMTNEAISCERASWKSITIPHCDTYAKRNVKAITSKPHTQYEMMNLKRLGPYGELRYMDESNTYHQHELHPVQNRNALQMLTPGYQLLWAVLRMSRLQ